MKLIFVSFWLMCSVLFSGECKWAKQRPRSITPQTENEEGVAEGPAVSLWDGEGPV